MSAEQRVVYYNGKFVPEREATVSIFDSALMFGDMVFEMTRSFNKVQFALREHIDRLYAGVKMLKIPITMTADEMEQAVQKTIEVNDPVFAPNDEHRVMIDVTRGPLSMYARVFDGNVGPIVIISVFPYKWTIAPLAPLYDTGIHAVTPSQRALPADLIDPKIKNRSRIHYLVANLEVGLLNDPQAWALLLDPDGFIAEGTGSNFFMAKDGVLYTPEPRNILRGVTRKYTMELARKIGLDVVECNLNTYDAINADEAFLVSTGFTLMHLNKVNGCMLGDGSMGPITKKLVAAWNEFVGLDFIAQAKEYYREMGGDAYEGTTMYRFGMGGTAKEEKK